MTESKYQWQISLEGRKVQPNQIYCPGAKAQALINKLIKGENVRTHGYGSFFLDQRSKRLDLFLLLRCYDRRIDPRCDCLQDDGPKV